MGDTNVFHYPLGIFRTLGATSSLEFCDYTKFPLLPQWQHFRDKDDRLKPIAEIKNKGPVWLGGLVELQDRLGDRHLVATYVKIAGKLEPTEYGLCEWDEDPQCFLPKRVLWKQTGDERRKPKDVLVPDGHAVKFKNDKGEEQLLFVNPFPQVQMSNRYEDWLEPTTWLNPELNWSESERAESQSGGNWTAGVWESNSANNVRQSIVSHRGDMAWSERIQKWVVVFTQRGGSSSYLGEVWYAESDTPFGPWSAPLHVLTHQNYTFYNPMIHKSALSKESPYLYFEGTYTAEFADRAEKTPKFDYNQLLYRVNLDEIRSQNNR